MFLNFLGNRETIEQMGTVNFRTFAVLKFLSIILSHPIPLAHIHLIDIVQ